MMKRKIGQAKKKKTVRLCILPGEAETSRCHDERVRVGDAHRRARTTEARRFLAVRTWLVSRCSGALGSAISVQGAAGKGCAGRREQRRQEQD